MILRTYVYLFFQGTCHDFTFSIVIFIYQNQQTWKLQTLLYFIIELELKFFPIFQFVIA